MLHRSKLSFSSYFNLLRISKLLFTKVNFLIPDLLLFIGLFFFAAVPIIYFLKTSFLTIRAKILAQAISKAFLVAIETVD